MRAGGHRSACSLVPCRVFAGRKRLEFGLRIWARLQVGLGIRTRLPSFIGRWSGRNNYGWRGDGIVGSHVDGGSHRGRVTEMHVGRDGQHCED